MGIVYTKSKKGHEFIQSIEGEKMKKTIKRILAMVLTTAALISAMPAFSLQGLAAEPDLKESEAGRAIDRPAGVPADATLWSGHYYKLYSAKMTLAAADAYCKSQGGYLATITSAGERNLIADLIDNLSSRDTNYTIGGRTGNFDAQNGMGFSKTEAHWDTGEEDNANYWQGNKYTDYCEKKDDAYRVISHYSGYSNTPLYRPAGYYWEPYDRGFTDEEYGFICEWGDRIEIGDAECTLDASYAIYDGRTKTPALTVKYMGVTLENKKDYTYEYTDNLNVGTATVIINGTGRFKGTTEVTFSVEPRISLSVTRDEEITTVCCQTAELAMENPDYLKQFITGLSLEVSQEDFEKFNGITNSVCISENGKNASWQVSFVGAKNGKISVNVSSAAGQAVTKNNIEIKTAFEVNTYRADYLLDNQSRLSAMEYFVTMETPGEIIVKNGEENHLGTATDFWKLLTSVGDGVDNVSAAIDIPFKEKEMYKAILLDIFEQSMGNEMLTSAEELSSKAKSALKAVTSVSDGINTLGDFKFFINKGDTYENMFNEKKDYASQGAAAVINKALELLKVQGHDVKADNIKDIVGTASTAKEVVEMAQEYLEYAVSCDQMREMSEDMQTILNEMYTASKSNLQLRLAFKEVSDMVTDSAAAVRKKLRLWQERKLRKRF